MENRVLKEHKIELTNRNLLKITGIERVDAITDKEVDLVVMGGKLTILGAQLKAESLSVENGTLVISGLVEAIKYSKAKEKVGLIKKIFK